MCEVWWDYPLCVGFKGGDDIFLDEQNQLIVMTCDKGYAVLSRQIEIKC